MIALSSFTASRLATGSFFVLCFFLPWSIAGMQFGIAGLILSAFVPPLARKLRGEPPSERRLGWGGAPGKALAIYAAWTILITILFAGKIDHLTRLANLWVLPLFWALPNAPLDKKNADRGLDLLLIVAGAMGYYGLIQYLFDVNPESVFKLTLEIDGQKSWWLSSHAQGFFSHALTYGGQMILWAGLYFYRYPQLKRWMKVGVGIGIGLGLLFCFQRSVWVAAFIMGCVGWAGTRWSGRRRWVALGVAAIMIVALVSASKMVRWRLSEISDLGRSNPRVSIWIDSLSLIEENLLVGVGHKRYRDAIIPFREDRRIYKHAHNSYLQIWAETGLIGLAIWLCFLAALGRGAIRGYRKGDSPGLGALGLGILGFMIMALFEYNWGDTEVWVAFLLCSAQATAAGTPKERLL